MIQEDALARTREYYNKHAASFVENTLHADVRELQETFLAYLPPRARILDFGCGSGRDSKYFLERGCFVEAWDASEELCAYSSGLTGLKVRCASFSDLQEQDYYDGIWACASLLHLPPEELVLVLQKIYLALKIQGVFYASFKYGNFSGMRNGRYFTDLDEDGLAGLLQGCEGWQAEKIWRTADVRPGRGEEAWLNLILRKS